MNTHVQIVTICFENCEYAEIPIKYFGKFFIDKISTGIYRIAMNAICKENCAEEVVLEIFSEVDQIGYHPCCNKKETASVINRISQYNDITSIEIKYEDGSEERYLVSYKTEKGNEYGPNTLQQSFVSELGNLYVLIGKKLNPEKIFPAKRINDPGEMGLAKINLRVEEKIEAEAKKKRKKKK